MATLDITQFGASPGSPDNTTAIQSVLDGAKQGDVVFVPPVGEFKVDALRSLKVRSGTDLKIDGVIRAIPNAQVDSVVVDVNSASNVTVRGTGAIAGERYQHTGPGPGRHGLCLQILSSSDVTVTGGLTLKEGYADGLYIQDSRRVTVNNIICSDNARNGCSLISGEIVTITNSTFELTHSESPMPQAGIDIEPDLVSQSLMDISITLNRFNKNKGPGWFKAWSDGPNRRRIYVVNNSFNQHYGDGSGPPTSGMNTTLCNFGYAVFRWMPGYDYWWWPREFTTS